MNRWDDESNKTIIKPHTGSFTPFIYFPFVYVHFQILLIIAVVFNNSPIWKSPYHVLHIWWVDKNLIGLASNHFFILFCPHLNPLNLLASKVISVFLLSFFLSTRPWEAQQCKYSKKNTLIEKVEVNCRLENEIIGILLRTNRLIKWTIRVWCEEAWLTTTTLHFWDCLIIFWCSLM